MIMNRHAMTEEVTNMGWFCQILCLYIRLISGLDVQCEIWRVLFHMNLMLTRRRLWMDSEVPVSERYNLLYKLLISNAPQKLRDTIVSPPPIIFINPDLMSGITASLAGIRWP